MTIDDAGHISAEDKARIIQGYRPHEVEARVRGIPMMGSGKVFPIAESVIAEEGGFPIPKFWPRIVGLDLGWDHATAACWLAWDRDADIVHVTDCYKVREQTALLHAEAIKARGSWIPVAWPHDAAATEKGGGETMAMQYRKLGLRMLDVHAQHPDGGISVEASIQDLLVRMQTSRLKIAAHLGDLWEELRLYHRKDGRLVKEFDDLISALRYGVMMLRHARTQPDYSQSRIRQAIGTGADPLGLYGPPTTHNAAPSSGGPVWGNGRPAHLEYNYRSRPRYARGIDDDVLS